ncbi:7671_t:CDS:1 [Dentiscutata heterogama]|uniref:7671_t:CDS:1 n=1 Tax=Dentiscutata heterogama TaxID=1316150 RepID=A0ACA9MAI6_9GLOM|nr:7671_t:CDS:1 [Dentiscutata heterogama]
MGLDGNIIQIWDSLSLVQDTLKIHKNAISMCCSEKQNSAGGWKWVYYENYIQPDPNEKWKEIELNSEKFKVSSLGRVQSINGMITQGNLYSGYLRICRRIKNYYIHRLIALAFCPKEPDKNYKNHIDGNSTNNKASNLE